ncbi:MAG TPA: phospholipase D-like domain-containing protein [Vicinamibacterales bacterium]|jgi:cardiolipin synthase|nr:phospholipase D-like domain-containing protein [Vicinamibacterales bacterium]
MTWLAVAGGVFLVWLVLVFLFTPGIAYHLAQRTSVHDADFLYTIQSTCQAALHHGNRVTVFTNGPAFYPAMLEAIRDAKRSINMECYIFQHGRVGREFIDALSERARNGVNVTIVIDAIGSFSMWGRPAARLRAAGCRLMSYQALRWYSLHRINNRTHRELLVVDGEVSFVGGAGIADWWAFPEGRRRQPWRDTMARIEGPIVAALQGVTAENWLECCGEILTGPDYFPSLKPRGETTAFVVKSSPSDRATSSRVSFQLLIEGADRTVRMGTPYFLPDRAFRKSLVMMAGRGVRITVIVPGPHTDQRWVRLASRRMWGQLLRAGVRIFEYGPSMMHAKTLIVDELWSVVGTTNIDNRSFEHNDEVNVAMRDPAVAARLLQDYERDLGVSDEITLERWLRRPIWEKIVGPFIWILERQQ